MPTRITAMPIINLYFNSISKSDPMPTRIKIPPMIIIGDVMNAPIDWVFLMVPDTLMFV